MMFDSLSKEKLHGAGLVLTILTRKAEHEKQTHIPLSDAHTMLGQVISANVKKKQEPQIDWSWHRAFWLGWAFGVVTLILGYLLGDML